MDFHVWQNFTLKEQKGELDLSLLEELHQTEQVLRHGEERG